LVTKTPGIRGGRRRRRLRAVAQSHRARHRARDGSAGLRGRSGRARSPLGGVGANRGRGPAGGPWGRPRGAGSGVAPGAAAGSPLRRPLVSFKETVVMENLAVFALLGLLVGSAAPALYGVRQPK